MAIDPTGAPPPTVQPTPQFPPDPHLSASAAPAIDLVDGQPGTYQVAQANTGVQLPAPLSNGGLVTSSPTVTDAVPEANPEYRNFVETVLLPQARQMGISETLLDEVFGEHGPAYDVDPVVQERQRPKRQAERRFSQLDYLDLLLGDDEWRASRALDEIETLTDEEHGVIDAYGFDPEDIVALWGIEGSFGDRTGDHNLFAATATVAFERGGDTFRVNQVLAALEIAQEQGFDPEELNSSWAGAFGHTQFIPTTYLDRARDGDGDGRIDLINSRADAFASTANYLNRSDWNRGAPALREAVVPPNFDFSLADGEIKRTVAEWREAGIEFIGGEDLDPSLSATLALTDRHEGPILARFSNWDAYASYNPHGAPNYPNALSVVRERSLGVEFGPWVTDPPLDEAERRFFQELLGFEGDDVDGVFGPGSGRRFRAAVQAYDFGGPVPGISVDQANPTDLERRLTYPTRAWLHRMAAAAGRSAELPAAPLGRGERLELQGHLQTLGLYGGALDGILGSGSNAAIDEALPRLGVDADSLRDADGDYVFRAVLDALRTHGAAQ